MSILRAPALLTVLLLSLAIPQALPCLCSILKNFKVMDWIVVAEPCLNILIPFIPDLNKDLINKTALSGSLSRLKDHMF